MSIEELGELDNSHEAPFSHKEYIIWLHNKIVDKINHDLWVFREADTTIKRNGYSTVNHIMNFPSLKPIR